MKESKYSPSKNLLFRETFTDEQSVRANGGVPTAVTFSQGIGTFSTGSLIGTKNSYNGTYSVRIKVKITSFTAVNYLIDFRGTNNNGIGRIYTDATAGSLSVTSGIKYINGVASSTTLLNSMQEIVVTGITIQSGTGTYQNIIGNNLTPNTPLTGSIELLEIYEGTLTAAEVKLLYSNSNYKSDDQRHVMRVVQDSGTVVSPNITTRIIRMLKQNNLYKGTRLLWDVNSGFKITTSGLNKYIGTAYSANQPFTPIDLTQTGADSIKPRLVGGIAPNSKYAASNQNGEARYFTHTPISFAAGDAWSVSLVTKFDGTSQAVHSMIGSSPNVDFGFKNGTNVFWFRNTNGGAFVSALPISNLIGKKTKITLVANGLGLLSIYVNGVFFESTSIATNITLSRFFYGSVGTTYIHNGLINYYRIQSGAMTAAQVLSESTFLTSLYPEVESIIIGTQTWATRNFEAVCTPMGNVIPNVTVNAGWANATVLYDAAYAADGGDATAKTYAGLKAAAMWCCYNNDAANGAIHGKLYNWYAVKLFDLDMASASFGWHVPTSTEFTTLQTYLGGVAVAGGKMKMTGLNYWATPNTGATNESGFTALANGLRLADGSFSELNITNRLWTSTSGNLTYNLNTDAVMYITSSNSLIRGCAIRLIKN